MTQEQKDGDYQTYLDDLMGDLSDEEDTGPPGYPNSVPCQGACNSRHPESEIIRCAAGHTFCATDCRAYTGTQLGQGVAVLKCILQSCPEIFPGTEVLKYIDLNLFKGVPRARLEVMIQRVGVKDLVEICIYCDGVVVCGPRTGNNDVVKCLNTACLKTSCRKCYKQAHVPQTCEVATKTSLECSHCHKTYQPIDIVRCEDGHPFCIESAKAYAAAQLGKGVPVLNCLYPGCPKIFPGVEVLRFIDLNIFKPLPRATKEKMIERVGVKDLVEICDYCEGVVECGPKTGKEDVIKCLNSGCLKTSCRKCRKLAHVGVTCEDAHKTSLECSHCSKVYPPSEIVRCEDGHPFCLESAKTYAAAQLGKGVPVLNCLYPGCPKIFPGVEVLRFIDLNVFKPLSKETKEKMIERVGVKDLVELCGYCEAVVECGPKTGKDDVIKCLNETCLKISCRKCRKLAHVGTGCEDSAKASLECSHCLKTYPASEIVRCEDGHPFCLDAAREYAGNQLGKGVPVLSCLYPGCSKIFPGVEVLRFIDLGVFKKLPKATKEAMIERVGVKGLVEICPNCETVVECGLIGPAGEREVMVCTEPTCGKSYCRLCWKESHAPLTHERWTKQQSGQDGQGDKETTEAAERERISKLLEKGITDGINAALGGAVEDPRDTVRLTIEGLITQSINSALVAAQFGDLLTAAIIRKCNTCSATLEKQNGNNTLTCTRCGTNQCNTCTKTIPSNPATHYEDSTNSCTAVNEGADPPPPYTALPGGSRGVGGVGVGSTVGGGAGGRGGPEGEPVSQYYPPPGYRGRKSSPPALKEDPKKPEAKKGGILGGIFGGGGASSSGGGNDDDDNDDIDNPFA